MLDPVYRAVAWQRVDQIRYNVILGEPVNCKKKTLRDIGVGGKITLKRITKKYDMKI
jgi:hypothetical protein